VSQADVMQPGLRRRIAGGVRRGRQSSLVWLIRIAALLIVFAMWEVVARNWISPLFIGQPTVIFASLWTSLHTSIVTVDLPTTLIETGVGYLIGSAAGMLVGFAVSYYPTWDRAFQPLFTALNSFPRIALTPLFILWFGIGISSKVALAISTVFFVVMLNTRAGMVQTDRDTELLSRSLGATELQRLTYFVLPAAIPVIAVGLQLGLVYAFLASVGGEIIAGEHGLGVILGYDANTFQTSDYFAVLLLLAIVTTAISGGLAELEKKLLWWHHVEMGGLR